MYVCPEKNVNVFSSQLLPPILSPMVNQVLKNPLMLRKIVAVELLQL